MDTVAFARNCGEGTYAALTVTLPGRRAIASPEVWSIEAKVSSLEDQYTLAFSVPSPILTSALNVIRSPGSNEAEAGAIEIVATATAGFTLI